MASPAKAWHKFRHHFLLSAECVAVSGFISMPVPVAEHFWDLLLFKAVHVCASVGHQSSERHGKLLFHPQGDTFYNFSELYRLDEEGAKTQASNSGMLSFKRASFIVLSSFSSTWE